MRGCTRAEHLWFSATKSVPAGAWVDGDGSG